MEATLKQIESWLKKYLNVTFYGACLVGSFFMEPAFRSNVGVMLFTALSVIEIQSIKEASTK